MRIESGSLGPPHGEAVAGLYPGKAQSEWRWGESQAPKGTWARHVGKRLTVEEGSWVSAVNIPFLV